MRAFGIGLSAAIGVVLVAYLFGMPQVGNANAKPEIAQLPHHQHPNKKLLHSVHRLDHQLAQLNARIAALEHTDQLPNTQQQPANKFLAPTANSQQLSDPMLSDTHPPVAPADSWSTEIADTDWQFTMEESVAGFGDYLFSEGLPSIAILGSDCRASLCRLTFTVDGPIEPYKLQHYLATYLTSTYSVVEVSSEDSIGVIFVRRGLAAG